MLVGLFLFSAMERSSKVSDFLAHQFLSEANLERVALEKSQSSGRIKPIVSLQINLDSPRGVLRATEWSCGNIPQEEMARGRQRAMKRVWLSALTAVTLLGGCGQSRNGLTSRSYVERTGMVTKVLRYDVTGKIVPHVGRQFLIIDRQGSSSAGPIWWKTNIPWSRVELYQVPDEVWTKALAIREGPHQYVEAVAQP